MRLKKKETGQQYQKKDLKELYNKLAFDQDSIFIKIFLIIPKEREEKWLKGYNAGNPAKKNHLILWANLKRDFIKAGELRPVVVIVIPFYIIKTSPAKATFLMFYKYYAELSGAVQGCDATKLIFPQLST